MQQILYEKIIITLGKQWIPAQLLMKNVKITLRSAISWGGSEFFFKKKNKHHLVSIIDGFGNSQKDSETKNKFTIFGQNHLAMTFSCVPIHLALIPTGESISMPQKNLANALPIKEVFEVCRVQLRALVLSVMRRITGWGSVVIPDLTIVTATQ